MPIKDKDEAVDRYTKRFAEFGYSPKSLGWDKGKQEIRFNVLTSKFNFQNKSILDIGCGFGDLNLTLEKRTGNSYRYLGIDIVEDFVYQARSRWKSENIEFSCQEFLSSEIDREIDISICSGILNFKLNEINNYDYFEAILKKSFEVSSEGVALDFLSDQADFYDENLFYFSPPKVIEIAQHYTKNIILRHDYMPFEFCLILFKNAEFSKEDTVFDRYKSEDFVL